MIRRPPRSTRTDTLFPYTTLFRSHVGHADDVAAPAPIELRLGTGRELRAFHHHVGAGAAQRQPEFPPGRFQRVAQPGADRVGDRDVGDHAGAEERLLSREGAVDELVDDDEGTGREIPAQRADGAERHRSEEHTSELQSLMRITYA